MGNLIGSAWQIRTQPSCNCWVLFGFKWLQPSLYSLCGCTLSCTLRSVCVTLDKVGPGERARTRSKSEWLWFLFFKNKSWLMIIKIIIKRNRRTREREKPYTEEDHTASPTHPRIHLCGRGAHLLFSHNHPFSLLSPLSCFCCMFVTSVLSDGMTDIPFQQIILTIMPWSWCLLFYHLKVTLESWLLR